MQDLIHKARNSCEVPVAAAIVRNNELISYGINEMERSKNACLHAEIIAINNACAALNSKYLTDCDIYVTLEPCPMCASAISLVKLKRLYFGAYDIKAGGVMNGPCIYNSKSCNHVPEVYGGILEEECSKLMRDFFAQQRL